MIVSVEEIAQGTINDELYQLCTNDAEKVKKYENYVAKKLWTIVDKEQFLAEDYPEDFKEATISLIQNLFIFTIAGKNSVATGRKTSKSEKIDDYSISESYEHYSPLYALWNSSRQRNYGGYRSLSSTWLSFWGLGN